MATYYVPRRRSSGKNSDRLGFKVFSYYRKEEREMLAEAAKRTDSSLSSFVAKASIAEAKRVLEEGSPANNQPLSLEDVLRALKTQVRQSELTSLVNRNGLTFTMSDKHEAMLRKAGAQPELLLQIYKARKSPK
ncbi:MAG: DUF1778 domain-containing protein [Terriglobales bacterium]